jgi:hypothetical protein
MSIRVVQKVLFVTAAVAVTACGVQGDGSTPTGISPIAAGGVLASGGGCSGPTKTEQLSGPALNGVVPEGRARADMSQFTCGGSTILTVEIKNVNLPDGTVVGVSLDWTPIGTITLSGQRGVLTTDLGHFGVSNDEVRVHYGDSIILIGPFFK